MATIETNARSPRRVSRDRGEPRVPGATPAFQTRKKKVKLSKRQKGKYQALEEPEETNKGKSLEGQSGPETETAYSLK